MKNLINQRQQLCLTIPSKLKQQETAIIEPLNAVQQAAEKPFPEFTLRCWEEQRKCTNHKEFARNYIKFTQTTTVTLYLRFLRKQKGSLLPKLDIFLTTIQTPQNRKWKIKTEENNELRCLLASRLWVSSRLSPFQHRDHKTANSLLHCLTQLVCPSSPSTSHISRKVILNS